MFGVLLLCGAALIALSLVLSSPAPTSAAPTVAILAVATVGGLALIMAGDRVRHRLLLGATAAASALACLLIYLSGSPSGVYSMMLVWIAVAQSYCFSRRAALAQLGWLLAAYAAALFALGPTGGHGPLTLWLLSAATLAVASSIGARLKRARQRAEQRTRRFFELSQDMLCTMSGYGQFASLNDAWTKTLGYSLDELRSRPFLEFVHPADRVATETRIARLLNGAGRVELANRFRAKDGSWHSLTWSVSRDAREGLVYARASDLTQRKDLERERQSLRTQVEALERTDPLTGLANRRAFEEMLEREMARARRLDSPLCLALIDLDRFKRYNDENGHATGDELLREAAGRWRQELRGGDFIARYGGEQFAVILPDCKPAGGEEVIDRLRSVVPRGETCSAGLAFWDLRGAPQALLTRAETALHRAKTSGHDRLMTAA